MKRRTVEILKQLLAGLQHSLWYTTSTTSIFEYNLQAATSLNEEEYETLLLASNSTVRNGDTSVYSSSKLENLQDILGGRLDILICRSKIERNGNPFISLQWEGPKIPNSLEQARDCQRNNILQTMSKATDSTAKASDCLSISVPNAQVLRTNKMAITNEMNIVNL